MVHSEFPTLLRPMFRRVELLTSLPLLVSRPRKAPLTLDLPELPDSTTQRNRASKFNLKPGQQQTGGWETTDKDSTKKVPQKCPNRATSVGSVKLESGISKQINHSIAQASISIPDFRRSNKRSCPSVSALACDPVTRSLA